VTPARRTWHPPGLLLELRQTAYGWLRHRATERSAALAFYTLFSIAPLLYLSIAIAGAALGREFVRTEMFSQAAALLGRDAATLLFEVLEASTTRAGAGLAGIVGLGTLIFGASAVFVQLQESLNAAWEVEPRPGPLLRDLARKRFLSLALVLVLGFVLLVSLLLSAALGALEGYLIRQEVAPPGLLQAGNLLLSFLVVTTLFASIYRILPDAVIAWRDVALGAVVTALLFSLGKHLIGLYLGRTGIVSAYGAAGSLVLVLLWVYYSSLIVLFGAEFTRVHSRRFRPRRVVPERGAARAPDAITREEDLPEPAVGGPP
jgi:membrane protein